MYKKIMSHTRIIYLLIAATLSLALPTSAVKADELGGTYEILGTGANIDIGGFGRSMISGRLHLDPQSGRFSIIGHSSDMELVEPCHSDHHSQECLKRHACVRFFNRKIESALVMFSGQYELLSDLTIRFKLDNEEDFNPVEGLSSPDGSLVTLPIHSKNGAILVIGMRASSALSLGDLQGLYKWSARVAEYPGHLFPSWKPWEGYRSGIESGSLGVTDGHYSSVGEGSLMRSIFYRVFSRDGCLVTAQQKSNPSPLALPTEGSFFVTPWGGIALGGDRLLSGLVSPDRQLIVAVGENSRVGKQGLVLMTRQGSGLNNMTVNGEYNAFALEDFFSSDARTRNAVVEGGLFLNGKTWFFSARTDSSVIRDECTGSDCKAMISQFIASGSAEGEYTVKDDGEMTMNGIAIDGNPRRFEGSVSSDGNIIVLRRVENNIPCDFFCTGTQSVRSIIVAVRRRQ